MSRTTPCDVQPGRWYLCGVCLTCQEPIPLVPVRLHVPLDGEASLVLKNVPCPGCGTRHDYSLSHGIRLRAAGTVRPARLDHVHER